MRLHPKLNRARYPNFKTATALCVVVQIGERETSVLRGFLRLTRGIHIPRSPICATTTLVGRTRDDSQWTKGLVLCWSGSPTQAGPETNRNQSHWNVLFSRRVADE